MRREGIADAAIDNFRHYYQQLEAVESGLLLESRLEPADESSDSSALRVDEGMY